MGFINDSLVGHFDPWIYNSDITWMSKTLPFPYWRGFQFSALTGGSRSGGTSAIYWMPFASPAAAFGSKGSLSVRRWIGATS